MWCKDVVQGWGLALLAQNGEQLVGEGRCEEGMRTTARKCVPWRAAGGGVCMRTSVHASITLPLRSHYAVITLSGHIRACIY